MTFSNANHYKVSQFKPEHDILMAEWINNPNRQSQNSLVAYEYAKLVCKEIRGTSLSMRSHNSFYIYREGEPYAMGWVGYADYTTTGTSRDPMFGVYSPHHKNRRYATYNEQYYMAIKNDRAKAIATAKSLLRSYTVEEAAAVSNRSVANHVTDVQSTAAKDVRTKAGKLDLDVGYKMERPLLHDELAHLVNIGHTFLNPELSGQIREYLDAFDLHIKRNAATIPMLYVDEVKDRFGDTLYRTCKVENARHYRPCPYHDMGIPETYLRDDIPDWIVSRVSALQLVDDDSYVEGVGYKHCATAYTIHVDDDNPFV
jgi:hypothetical protein